MKNYLNFNDLIINILSLEQNKILYVSPLSWNAELVYIANVNTPSFHALLEVNNSDLECAARGAGSVDRM